MTLSAVFLLVACILLFCAAFGVPSSRVSLGWLGMALWSLSLLIGGFVVRAG